MDDLARRCLAGQQGEWRTAGSGGRSHRRAAAARLQAGRSHPPCAEGRRRGDTAESIIRKALRPRCATRELTHEPRFHPRHDRRRNASAPCERWRLARSAWSTATSARARCTRCRRRSAHNGMPPTPKSNVLGVLSLIFWALILVVSLKYVVLHHARRQQGRGRHHGADSRWRSAACARASARAGGSSCSASSARRCSIGDGVITPAISVLSARRRPEGRSRRHCDHWVVPLTAVIVLLPVRVPAPRHRARRHGVRTGDAALVRRASRCSALARSLSNPQCAARDQSPYYGVSILLRTRHAWRSSRSATVVLALTGAEALYADMGHFGKRPIRLAWFSLVLPALVLNYFGQGALLLANPQAVDNPFFKLVPPSLLYPDDRARDGGHGDRLAGGDLRRVLDDARGDPARLLCRAWKCVHTSRETRGQIYRAVGQPHAAGADAGGRGRFPLARTISARPTASR